MTHALVETLQVNPPVPRVGKSLGALVALSLSAFVYVTTESLPIGLLLDMSGGLHVSISAVGSLVSAYGLIVVLASIPLTQATRRLPRRPLMAALLAGFVVATLLSVVTSNYSLLLGARVMTALSQALFWSLVIPTATATVPPAARGRALAIVFAGSSLAFALGGR